LFLTDTHCHLYLEKFGDDLNDVLTRAAESGVKRIYLPAIDWESLRQMDTLSFPDIEFYKMVGIHPCHVHENWPLDEDKLFRLASSDDFIAVGETGLDYYRSQDFVKEQKMSLASHCSVAKSVGKPVVLHNRDATTDLMDLIEKEQDGSLTGVWHCFNGSVEEGERAVDLGLYLGIGGVLTFKNAGVDKTARKLPIEKIILETDAPYLAPEPKRGERNEPSYVAYTAEKLAAILERPVEEVAEMTTQNAERLFASPES